VLRLPLTDPGFDASVLCEFRARLLGGEAERLLLDTLLEWCRERGLLKARPAASRSGPSATAAAWTMRGYQRVRRRGPPLRWPSAWMGTRSSWLRAGLMHRSGSAWCRLVPAVETMRRVWVQNNGSAVSADRRPAAPRSPG